jgi:restriction system protein
MERDRDERPEVYARKISKQYYRRLFCYENHLSKSPPWEGITWILDLLPDHPRKALQALTAYISAHAQMLPDGRFQGLLDAAEIIRAKFIGTPRSNSEKVHFLRDLEWRDFECLVAALYRAMRYETQLTPPTKDGGRDIIATKRSPGRLEHLRIECKLYNQEPVGLGFVQRLLGVVSGEKVNKGVLVTSSRFTKPALKYAKDNPRLELINGVQLVALMNEYLGSTWPLHLELLIAEGHDNQRKKVRSS